MSKTERFVNREGAEEAGNEVSFSFGENWQKFLDELNEDRVAEAQLSLQRSFDSAPFRDQDFIDVGCGSGLFSLCAGRLQSRRVTSIDIDPASVRCAAALRARLHQPSSWHIIRGSILDEAFIRSIEPATRVFSWGVLHHTGALWRAIENTLTLVRPGGLCCLAIYNRPTHPKIAFAVKRTYNSQPALLKPLMRSLYGSALLCALALNGRNPIAYMNQYPQAARGMSFWRDVEDWLGGLPYEYASKDEVVSFVAARGFILRNTIIRPPGANNEYLFERF